MNNLNLFYDDLRGFLLRSGIESDRTLLGYTEAEIEVAESNSGTNFPAAYKLFMQKFGKKANFHDCQYYRFDGLTDSRECAQEIAMDTGFSFQNLFPFAQWQGYAVYCFRLDASANPETVLIVFGDESLGAETYIHATFTDWLLDVVRTYIKLKVSLKEKNAPQQITLFEEFASSLSCITK